jgi:hypothetical protein
MERMVFDAGKAMTRHTSLQLLHKYSMGIMEIEPGLWWGMCTHLIMIQTSEDLSLTF